MESESTPHRVEIIWHSEDELNQLSMAVRGRPKLSERQMQRARLEPIDPPPMVDPQAERVKQRLMTPYRFEALTKLPAAASVGSLTKTGRLAPAGQSTSREAIVPFEVELTPPKCIGERSKASPTEIGSANHLVLEHLNFSRTSDATELQKQIADLIDRKLLDPELAKTVDVSAIEWLMTTPFGELLRRNAASLRREVWVYFPQGSDDSIDPMDRVMVRGRIDVLIPDKDGLVIADFKTDQLTPQTVDARAEFYRPQIEAYRDAISAIANKPVHSSMLVFLAARVVKEV